MNSSEIHQNLTNFPVIKAKKGPQVFSVQSPKHIGVIWLNIMGYCITRTNCDWCCGRLCEMKRCFLEGPRLLKCQCYYYYLLIITIVACS